MFGDGIASGVAATGDVAAAAGHIFTFVNSYDGSSQEAVYQIPGSYSGGTPTPLVIFAHGRTGVMQDGLNVLGNAANAKGWLLASPQMHGSWVVPPECYIYSNTCDYDDKVLAGTTSPTSEPKPGAYAHASLESQYDIIGTAKYMVEHFNVKPDQIYLVGYSMGGQIATATAAKFPHLFAAVFDNKGITNQGQWYWEVGTEARRTLEKECHVGGVRKMPSENPFCYERRSSVNMGRNFAHIPISMTHSAADLLVPISHSYKLRDAINSYGPDRTASVYVDTVIGPTCPPYYHCYEPNPPAIILNWLAPFSLDNNPSRVRITADESKSFYWMTLTQSGGAHWTHIDATRHTDSPTVSATNWDNSPATLDYNLGSTSLPGEVFPRPGMGLPATTYLVKGGGNHALRDYTSGNLRVQVSTTGQSTITISAIAVSVSADPPIVSIPQAPSSTIAVQVRDRLGNPVPNGTSVQLLTTAGTFPNGQSTYSRSTTNGQATATLTLGSGDNQAQIVAIVRMVSGSTSVQAIRPAIAVQAASQPTMIYQGQPATYQYQVTNTGDATLSQVTVIDDNGTPGNPGDDVTVCSGITLAAGASRECSRTTTPAQTTTVVATVTGQDALGYPVSDSATTTVQVISPGIAVRVQPQPGMVYAGDLVTYEYTVTNEGDVTLSQVAVVDNNGTPADTADDIIVCSGFILTAGASKVCSHTAMVTRTTTTVATATGQDPLGGSVNDSDQATITVISPSIDLVVTTDRTVVDRGEPVTYRYQVTNTGNVTLSQVTVIDDNGTPGNPGDDVTVCSQITLAAGASRECSRTTTPASTTTIAATATGQDPLGGPVNDSGQATVQVKYRLYLPMVIAGT